MITLNQNTHNNVYLTLSESVTLTATSVYFLFRFVNESTNNELLFTGTDLSTNIVRYNLFDIVVTGSTYVNKLNSQILLEPQGKYKYEVYEMTSPTNLYISGTTGVPIEYGIVQLSGTSLEPQIFYTGQTNNYDFYEPQH